MKIHFAFILIGSFDLLLGWVFWWLHKRVYVLTQEWPDPTVRGQFIEEHRKLTLAEQNLRILRVVCVNTGASILCTGLLLLIGAP